MTLKNLQEKGKKELEEVINNSYEILDTKGKGFEQVSEFLSKQTFIAYELGRKEMKDEVLKEIDEYKKEMHIIANSMAIINKEAILGGITQTCDSLKEKLTNNK